MQQPTRPAQAPAFRQVDSGHGVEWWSSAWRLLFSRSAAGVWIVMCVVAFVVVLALSALHLVGTIAAQIAWFALAGGMMLAARKTEEGAAPPFGDLFAGFGAPLGPLAIGGALVGVAVLLVELAATVAGIGTAVGAFYGAMTGNFALLLGLGASALLVVLIALLALLPVFMAAWLAPALIVLRQQPPVEALKASLAACRANLGALTVYGLLWIAFAFATLFTLGIGWLVLWPLMVLSTYAAYRDLFEAG
jgi:hypothetical protein